MDMEELEEVDGTAVLELYQIVQEMMIVVEAEVQALYGLAE